MTADVQALRTPMIAETLEMQKLVNTYGKTFHTWQVDRGDPLPYGQPSLRLPFSRSQLMCILHAAHPAWHLSLNLAQQQPLLLSSLLMVSHRWGMPAS